MVAIAHHIHFHAAYFDGAFDAQGHMVGVVAYPYGHFFAAFEDGALYEERFELDAAEFSIPGFDDFLAEITDV